MAKENISLPRVGMANEYISLPKMETAKARKLLPTAGISFSGRNFLLLSGKVQIGYLAEDGDAKRGTLTFLTLQRQSGNIEDGYGLPVNSCSKGMCRRRNSFTKDIAHEEMYKREFTSPAQIRR